MNDGARVCPVCGSEATFAFTKDHYDLYRCRACDFMFVSPFPSPEAVHAYYAETYRSATKDFYPKARSRVRRSFMRSLLFFRYAYKKKVIDLGCGGGFMVEAFRHLGGTSCGIDLSENSISYARNHFRKCNFYCEPLSEFSRRGLKFDFVFSSEVLEHLPGPHEFMETLRKITHEHSVVYISAPDAGHPHVPDNIAEWSDICPPEHLEFFNIDNVQYLFRQYGFVLRKNYGNRKPALSLLFERRHAPVQSNGSAP